MGREPNTAVRGEAQSGANEKERKVTRNVGSYRWSTLSLRQTNFCGCLRIASSCRRTWVARYTAVRNHPADAKTDDTSVARVLA